MIFHFKIICSFGLFSCFFFFFFFFSFFLSRFHEIHLMCILLVCPAFGSCKRSLTALLFTIILPFVWCVSILLFSKETAQTYLVNRFIRLIRSHWVSLFRLLRICDVLATNHWISFDNVEFESFALFFTYAITCAPTVYNQTQFSLNFQFNLFVTLNAIVFARS